MNHRRQNSDEISIMPLTEPEEITDEHFFSMNNFSDEEYSYIQQDIGNKRGYQSRNWCFTWNNYNTDNCYDRLKNLDNVEYMIYGHEIGKSGTPHLQGFVIFKSDRRFGTRLKYGGFHPKSLKGMFPEVHWKPMYSKPENCIAYCKKDQNYVEYGIPPIGQGNNRQLLQVCNRLVAGTADLQTIAREFPQEIARFGRGIITLYSLLLKHREDKPAVIWFYGDSGVGKTTYAYNIHGRNNVHKQQGGGFMNGYEQQDALLIDEFRLKDTKNTTGWEFHEFLQLIDKHPFHANTKGSYVPVNSPFIYITSIYHPKVFFPKWEDFKQVLRRLDMIYHVLDENTFREDTKYNDYYFSEAKLLPCNATTPLLQDLYKTKYPLTKSARNALAISTPQVPILDIPDDYSDMY